MQEIQIQEPQLPTPEGFIKFLRSIPKLEKPSAKAVQEFIDSNNSDMNDMADAVKDKLKDKPGYTGESKEILNQFIDNTITKYNTFGDLSKAQIRVAFAQFCLTISKSKQINGDKCKLINLEHCAAGAIENIERAIVIFSDNNLSSTKEEYISSLITDSLRDPNSELWKFLNEDSQLPYDEQILGGVDDFNYQNIQGYETHYKEWIKYILHKLYNISYPPSVKNDVRGFDEKKENEKEGIASSINESLKKDLSVDFFFEKLALDMVGAINTIQQSENYKNALNKPVDSKEVGTLTTNLEEMLWLYSESKDKLIVSKEQIIPYQFDDMMMPYGNFTGFKSDILSICKISMMMHYKNTIEESQSSALTLISTNRKEGGGPEENKEEITIIISDKSIYLKVKDIMSLINLNLALLEIEKLNSKLGIKNLNDEELTHLVNTTIGIINKTDKVKPIDEMIQEINTKLKTEYFKIVLHKEDVQPHIKQLEKILPEGLNIEKYILEQLEKNSDHYEDLLQYLIGIGEHIGKGTGNVQKLTDKQFALLTSDEAQTLKKLGYGHVITAVTNPKVWDRLSSSMFLELIKDGFPYINAYVETGVMLFAAKSMSNEEWDRFFCKKTARLMKAHIPISHIVNIVIATTGEERYNRLCSDEFFEVVKEDRPNYKMAQKMYRMLEGRSWERLLSPERVRLLASGLRAKEMHIAMMTATNATWQKVCSDTMVKIMAINPKRKDDYSLAAYRMAMSANQNWDIISSPEVLQFIKATDGIELLDKILPYYAPGDKEEYDRLFSHTTIKLLKAGAKPNVIISAVNDVILWKKISSKIIEAFIKCNHDTVNPAAKIGIWIKTINDVGWSRLLSPETNKLLEAGFEPYDLKMIANTATEEGWRVFSSDRTLEFKKLGATGFHLLILAKFSSAALQTILLSDQNKELLGAGIDFFAICDQDLDLGDTKKGERKNHKIIEAMMNKLDKTDSIRWLIKDAYVHKPTVRNKKQLEDFIKKVPEIIAQRACGNGTKNPTIDTLHKMMAQTTASILHGREFIASYDAYDNMLESYEKRVKKNKNLSPELFLKQKVWYLLLDSVGAFEKQPLLCKRFFKDFHSELKKLDKETASKIRREFSAAIEALEKDLKSDNKRSTKMHFDKGTKELQAGLGKLKAQIQSKSRFF